MGVDRSVHRDVSVEWLWDVVALGASFLEAALGFLAEHSAVQAQVKVMVNLVRRLAREVESAAYFVVGEP